MKLTSTATIDLRSAGGDDVTAAVGQEAILVPGGTTCCSNGASSSCTSCGAPATFVGDHDA